MLRIIARRNEFAARLTKPARACKACIALLGAGLAFGAAADRMDPGDPIGLRKCITAARDGAAVAACELQAQAFLKTRIDQLTQAIRTRLDRGQRQVFERNLQAWQAWHDSEIALLDLSLGQRPDGLGAKLRPGAITRLYEQREQQLREHMHNLSLARPAGARPGR